MNCLVTFGLKFIDIIDAHSSTSGACIGEQMKYCFYSSIKNTIRLLLRRSFPSWRQLQIVELSIDVCELISVRLQSSTLFRASRPNQSHYLTLVHHSENIGSLMLVLIFSSFQFNFPVSHHFLRYTRKRERIEQSLYRKQKSDVVESITFRWIDFNGNLTFRKHFPLSSFTYVFLLHDEPTMNLISTVSISVCLLRTFQSETFNFNPNNPFNRNYFIVRQSLSVNRAQYFSYKISTINILSPLL